MRYSLGSTPWACRVMYNRRDPGYHPFGELSYACRDRAQRLANLAKLAQKKAEHNFNLVNHTMAVYFQLKQQAYASGHESQVRVITQISSNGCVWTADAIAFMTSQYWLASSRRLDTGVHVIDTLHSVTSGTLQVGQRLTLKQEWELTHDVI